MGINNLGELLKQVTPSRIALMVNAMVGQGIIKDYMQQASIFIETCDADIGV